VWQKFVFAKINTGVAYFFSTIILLATASATPVIIHNSFIIFTSVIVSVKISDNFSTFSLILTEISPQLMQKIKLISKTKLILSATPKVHTQ